MRQLLAILTFALAFNVSAGCNFKGEKYPLFESIAVQDRELADIPGVNPDATVLVLRCLPVVDIKAVEKGDFGASSIPSTGSEWIPSQVLYSRYAYENESFSVNMNKF